MIGPLLTLFLALVVIGGPTPAPTATPLGPAWVPVPLKEAEEYAHYLRHEQDGTDSQILAARKVCDCQPDDAMRTLEGLFGQMNGVSVRRDVVAACDRSADRLLVTGLAATESSHSNIEAVMFRSGTALYSLIYSFRSAAPMTDAESALLTLCGGAN
jgi:hypothetical protein